MRRKQYAADAVREGEAKLLLTARIERLILDCSGLLSRNGSTCPPSNESVLF